MRWHCSRAGTVLMAAAVRFAQAHLSDEEFAKVMGCSKEEYGDLASFAQMRLKIKAKLM